MKDNSNQSDTSRRASERLPLEAMVAYRLNGQEYGNLAADISSDGIFIKTFMPPPVGCRLDLTVRLPEELGGFAVDLEGEVVRVVEDDDPRKNGMGVHFTAVHAVEPEAVRHLVSLIFHYEALHQRQTDHKQLDGD